MSTVTSVHTDQKFFDNLDRCGKCRNCQYIARQRHRMLAAQRPWGKGITQDMVDLWNDAMTNFPCTEESTT